MTTATDDDVLAVVQRARVLPVLRAGSADAALALVEPLVAAGLPVVELTTTVPGWEEAVAGARARWPQLRVGVGTVTDPDLARRALRAGAAFLVSPWPVPGVREAADADGRPFLEGGVTPAEVAAAAGRGVAKLFPAHVGGPAYLRSLLAVLPGARVVPTGGIALDDVGEWLDAGAFAVGVGSDLSRAAARDPEGTARRIAALGAAG